MVTVTTMVQVMLTTRNVFIANLAVSDLLLCTFTMPLTLLDLLTKYWPLGPDMDTVILVAVVLPADQILGTFA